MEFQRQHLKTFGIAISPEEAETELLSLAELIRITQAHKTKENENEE
jgi:hypothetical protein